MFALFALVAYKVFALKVREIGFLASISTKGDQKIHQLIENATVKYERYAKIVNIFIFDFLPHFMYELLVKTKDFVAKKYYEAGDGFRGRRILKSTGSVSFFLERLSEETGKNQ
jgi:hypothetical protein